MGTLAFFALVVLALAAVSYPTVAAALLAGALSGAVVRRVWPRLRRDATSSSLSRNEAGVAAPDGELS